MNDKRNTTRHSFRVCALGIVLMLAMLFSSDNEAAHAISAPTAAATVSVAALQPITVNNVNKMKLLTRLGRGDAYTIAWSPDGKTLAVGGTRGIWLYAASDLPNSQPRLLPNSRLIVGIAFSADGSRLAADDTSDCYGELDDLRCFGESSLYIWDVATGRLVTTISTPIVGAVGFDLSRDGKLLAFTPVNTSGVVIWSLTTNRAVVTVPIGDDSNDRFNGVTFSPDGSRFAAASEDQGVGVWDSKTGKRLMTYNPQTRDAAPDLLAFSPDGQRLAASNAKQSTVVLLDTTSGKLLTTLSADALSGINSFTFNADGKQIVAGGDNGTIVFWDIASGTLVKTLQVSVSLCPACKRTVTDVSLSQDDLRLAFMTDMGVLLWDLSVSQPSILFRNNAFELTDLAVSPDGQRVAAAGDSQNVLVWNVADDSQVLALPGHIFGGYAGQCNCDLPPPSVAFSPDGQAIATADRSGTIRFWDPVSGQLLHSLEVSQSHAQQTYRARFVLQVRFNPTNKQQLAFVGVDQTLHILDVGAGVETLHLAGGNTDNIQAFGFTADGKQIAAIFSADTLKVWDTTTGKLITTLTSGIVSEMEYFALSPNGKYIATDDYGDYSAINLWDVVHAQLLIRLPTTDRIIAFAFSSDSRLLAATLGDGSVAVWDVAQLTKRATLQMGVYALSIAFSLDGTRLLAAGADGTVWVWGVPGGTR